VHIFETVPKPAAGVGLSNVGMLVQYDGSSRLRLTDLKSEFEIVYREF